MWGLFGKKPREGTEAHRVFEEVQKRKRAAREIGVDKLISDLYFSQIQYYPSWIQHSRDYVPDEISQATESGSKKEDAEKVIEITLFDKKYTFEFGSKSFSLPDGENTTHGDLTLYENEKKVLKLNCSLNYDEICSEWRPFDIEAYIEGNWIGCFTKLKEIIKEKKEQKEIQGAEDPDLVKKMKENFGIK